MTILVVSKKMQVILNLIYFTHFTEQPEGKLPSTTHWGLKFSKLGKRYPQNE